MKRVLLLLIVALTVFCIGDLFGQGVRSPQRARIRVMSFDQPIVFIDAEFIGIFFDSTDNVIAVLLDPCAAVLLFCPCKPCPCYIFFTDERKAFPDIRICPVSGGY